MKFALYKAVWMWHHSHMAPEETRPELPAGLGSLSSPNEPIWDTYYREATRFQASSIDVFFLAFLRRVERFGYFTLGPITIDVRLIEDIVERTTQPSETLLADLKRIVAEQKRLEPGDTDGFAEADRAFHRALYEAAGVPDLWQLVRRHSGHIDRLRLLHLPLPGKMSAIIRDHEAIVAAVARGDADAAAAALRRHLSGTLSIVDEIRRQHPDYLLPE